MLVNRPRRPCHVPTCNTRGRLPSWRPSAPTGVAVATVIPTTAPTATNVAARNAPRLMLALPPKAWIDATPGTRGADQRTAALGLTGDECGIALPATHWAHDMFQSCIARSLVSAARFVPTTLTMSPRWEKLKNQVALSGLRFTHPCDTLVWPC